jgi:hypothetical protein
VVGPEPAPGQRRRPGALDHDVDDGEQRAQLVGLAVEINAIRKLFTVHPVKEGAIAGPGAVRAAWALDFDDGCARACQQLPAQRAGPHRRQVGHQQARQAALRGPGSHLPYPR